MRFFDRLMSDKSAKDWNGAYPIGNGSLGAMVDGKTDKETFYFNDDTFWTGNSENPTFRPNDVFAKVRALTMAGKIGDAEDILYKDVYGEYAESYMPLAELHMTRHFANIMSYNRTLDLTTAVSKVTIDDTVERSFVTHVDRAFCLDVKTSKNMEYTFDMSNVTHFDVAYSIENNSGIIVMNTTAPSHKDPLGHEQAVPIIYDESKISCKAYVKAKIISDGIIVSDTQSISVNNGTYIRVYLASTTNMRDDKCKEVVDNIIDKVSARDIEDVIADHINDYKSLYDRCDITLGADRLDEDMTTVEALKKHHKHPDVATLMFNYARFLMIEGSREDSRCMNLQGIWNGKLQPPWSSAYTVNINIEMNYWIAESANLSECHMPLMRQLEVMERSGRRTAREQIGVNGWCCGHNSDIWGHTNLTGRVSTFNPSMYAMYVGGGAWLATHIYTHYAYTNDIDFLKKYYYILRGSAEFCLDYLMQDNESKYLVMCPSASPENSYILNGEKHAISKNATMETAIARNIFRIIGKVGEIVGEDREFLSKCSDAMAQLYPYKIGAKGGIVEWYDDYKESERTHRHVSHLYGLYPDCQITVDDTPELATACLNTIKRRGNKGIGWSLTWKISLLARLREGDKALKALCEKTKYYNPKHAGLNYGGCYDNLFSAPPMQIDGNFGIAAGIIEMLLQSYDKIRLLPALPKSWSQGSFNGLKAKGGYTVDCVWNNGKVTGVKVSGEGDTIDIVIDGKTVNIPLNKMVAF